MINSLSTRITLSLLALLLVFGSLSAALFVYNSKQSERQSTQEIHRDLAQHVVDHYLLFKDGKPDRKAAKSTFRDLMILGPNFEFYLLDKTGSIVSFDAAPEQVKLDKIKLEPIQAFLAAEKGSIVLGPDPKNINKEKVFSVAPIYQMGEVYGYLYIIIGSQAKEALQNAHWYKNILQSGLGLLLLVVVFSAFAITMLIACITRPLNKLIKQAQNVKMLGFDKSLTSDNNELLTELSKWQAESDNDIQILGHAFYDALLRLQQQYDKVVSIDELRKELLSHVSHDLRTPLASLLGYLETWELQQDSMTAEQSKQFIATARNSAKKISRLIEQLFELAYLDGSNVNVRKESVAIAELVQDVLQKFQLSSAEKNISLSVDPRDSGIVVRADIEKLERVFTNLIENALRHTPDGGHIKVNIKEGSGLVSINVSDNGIGIPEQDLQHIFEPHFKAGNSVRENTAHGGLGLAITRKLLELHESAIEVQSQLNTGTTFSFALPQA
ncbi:ATP-binding protein [Agaribacterium sp. ZY112]|uniref:sensor histidine kinase n=1 Tax=Agaribacterium sp. ZY112 TaxID=3233574 RepID=UPI0035255694